jgi:hypothetical protein
MSIITKHLLSLILVLSLIEPANSQSASFIAGIKNDWTFFTDRIIYGDNSGIYYRLNGDNYLYYSDGTTAGSKATAYVFGNDVFSNPDFGVFSHDDKHTALGTNKAPHDIIIFKDKSCF